MNTHFCTESKTGKNTFRVKNAALNMASVKSWGILLQNYGQ